jgi:hypothetical protein
MIPHSFVKYPDRAALSLLRESVKGIFFLAFFLLPWSFLPFARAASNACPAEYGETLYECNPAREKQVFIIGMGHRDALTGANGPRTARVQAEVYKVGEWLIREEGVELILPEGFFKSPGGGKASGSPSAVAEKKRSADALDLKGLEAKLSDPKIFVNAEILWKRNYGISLQQVEDRDCYEGVGALVAKLAAGCSADEYTRTRANLDSLQDRRTALMLQKIPEIIDREYGEKRIKTRKAILTIGLSHIPPILKFVKEGGFRLSSQAAANDDFDTLNLLRQNFRVSILIPRSLADDPKTLEMNGLGRNLLDLSLSGAKFSPAEKRRK